MARPRPVLVEWCHIHGSWVDVRAYNKAYCHWAELQQLKGQPPTDCKTVFFALAQGLDGSVLPWSGDDA